MPNTHHVEPPPHHVDPPPHDPGKPDHPEPERPGEEHIFEPEGWGLDPLVTNPFRPGDDLASLNTHARDVFVLPEPVAPNAAALPPEYQAFTQAVARIQEPFNHGIEGAAGDKIKEGWDNQKALARSYQACLPDYWRDAVTFMQEHVGKIADKGKRNEYQGKLNDLFKNQDNLLEKLSRWNKERRNYPYDWEALSRLQNELNSELSGCLYQLRQIEAGYDKKKEGASYQNLDTAITSGRYFFSALGVELGRQGEELTKSATIYYGSASETAANALASTTHQNDVVLMLSDRATLKKWTNELALPTTFSDANPTRKKWNAEVIEPLTEKTNDWLEASKGDPDYDELKSATESLLVESFTQRDSLNNLDIKNIPDFIRNKARDALSLLSDVMANRLNELREKADLTQGKMLHGLIKDIRVLRENTTTEVLAREADQGISKFWSGKKDAALKKIESDFPDGGKELRRTLDLAFAEGLGGLLDKWSDEMKKAPKHSAKTLHDATWDVRFAVRRYRDSVKTILAAPAYAEHRLQLLASLDALQIAVSNRLRQAYQDGYYLF